MLFRWFCLGSTPEFKNKIIGELKKTFSGSLQEYETFPYLGPYIKQKDGVISAHQIPYINDLQKCVIEKGWKELQSPI